jgi:hypothetical protein
LLAKENNDRAWAQQETNRITSDEVLENWRFWMKFKKKKEKKHVGMNKYL